MADSKHPTHPKVAVLDVESYIVGLPKGINISYAGVHPGGMQAIEGDLLCNLAFNWGGPVFEIGVEYGNSTMFIADGLNDGSKIYSCDPQDVRHYRPRCQVFYQYPSTRVFPREKCAWAFIDGDHRLGAVVDDIIHCERLGIPRMVFHDARLGDPCVPGNGQSGTDVYAAATQYFLEPGGTELEYKLTWLDSPCGILIAERTCPKSASD